MNQKYEEFCGFRITRIPANDMDIIGSFIKALASAQREFFSAFHLHYDGAFQHVNRHLRIVAVDRA